MLTQRKATLNDLATIVALLADDAIGAKRESASSSIDKRYYSAFAKIDADPNQYLMVIEQNHAIVGTCHLTLMPSLTFVGATRLQIEAVRIASGHRGEGIGSWMIEQVLAFAKAHEVKLLQLTTNKQRHQAKQFYEKFGFEATHEGMKLCLVG